MTGLSSSPLRMERQNSSLTGNDDRKLELEREKERERERELTSKILERAELAQMTRKLKLGLGKVPTVKLSVSRNSSPRKRRSPQRVTKGSQSGSSSPSKGLGMRRLTTTATLVGSIDTNGTTRGVSSPLGRTQVEAVGDEGVLSSRSDGSRSIAATSLLKRSINGFSRDDTDQGLTKNQKYVTPKKQNTQLEKQYLMTPMASNLSVTSGSTAVGTAVGTAAVAGSTGNNTSITDDGIETGADLLMYLTTSPFSLSKEDHPHDTQMQHTRQHNSSENNNNNNNNNSGSSSTNNRNDYINNDKNKSKNKNTSNNDSELDRQASGKVGSGMAVSQEQETMVPVPTTPSSNPYSSFNQSSTTHNDAERLSHMKPSIGSPQSALRYAYGLPHSGSAQLAELSDDILLQSPSIFLNATDHTAFQSQHRSEPVQRKPMVQVQSSDRQETPKTPSQDQVPSNENMPSATFSMLNLLKTPNFNFGDYIHSIFSPSPKVSNPTISALRKPNVPPNKIPPDTPGTNPGNN